MDIESVQYDEIKNILNAIEKMESKIPEHKPWVSTLKENNDHGFSVKVNCTLTAKNRTHLAHVEKVEVFEKGKLVVCTNGLSDTFEDVKLLSPEITNPRLSRLGVDTYLDEICYSMKSKFFTGNLEELIRVYGGFHNFRSSCTFIPVEVIVTHPVGSIFKRWLGKKPQVETFQTQFQFLTSLRDLSTAMDRAYHHKEELLNHIRQCLEDNVTLYGNIAGFSSYPEIQSKLKELFNIYDDILNQNTSIEDNNNHTLS